MPDFDNLDSDDIVVDVVHNAVVADAYAETGSSLQLPASGGTGDFGKTANGGKHTALRGRVESFQLSFGCFLYWALSFCSRLKSSG